MPYTQICGALDEETILTLVDVRDILCKRKYIWYDTTSLTHALVNLISK